MSGGEFGVVRGWNIGGDGVDFAVAFDQVYRLHSVFVFVLEICLNTKLQMGWVGLQQINVYLVVYCTLF